MTAISAAAEAPIFDRDASNDATVDVEVGGSRNSPVADGLNPSAPRLLMPAARSLCGSVSASSWLVDHSWKPSPPPCVRPGRSPGTAQLLVEGAHFPHTASVPKHAGSNALPALIPVVAQ